MSRLRDPAVADLALAVTLCAVETLTCIALVVPVMPNAPEPAVIVIAAAVMSAPIALRRRFPVAAMVTTICLLPFYWAFGQNNEIGAWMAIGIVVYSASAYGRRPAAGWVCVGLLTALALLVAVDAPDLESPAQIAAGTLFLAVPFGLAWSMGSIVRELRSTRSQLEERNAELAREREAGAHRAVLEERVRIARELHDVVAHYVSLMSIQAGVARRLFASRPDEALAAIGEVETAARQAVADLHQLLTVLRSEEPALGTAPRPERAPQPDLRQLPDLLEHTRRAGLAIDLTIEGEPRPLPAGIELSLYRIAQEALTNTVKHAGATRAAVRLHYLADSVELDVVDDGQGSEHPGVGEANGGKGLLGMRERMGLHGGRLEAGRTPSGGYRIHAVVGVR